MNNLESKQTIFEELHRNWGWLLAMGIILIVLGFLAIRAAFVATMGTVLFLGGVLTMAGIVEVIHAFQTRKWGGFFMNLLGGLLTAAVGIFLFARPVAGAASLTLALGAFLLAIGSFRALTAIMIRFEQWGWYLFSGIVTFILGLLILFQWPASSLWLLGTFVGIELLFTGWSTVMLAFGARRLPEESHMAHA